MMGGGISQIEPHSSQSQSAKFAKLIDEVKASTSLVSLFAMTATLR
jgi:hypothetical protein